MKTSREMQRNTDVKGSFADMQSKMEALNATMSQTANGQAIAQGIPAAATITSAQPTGAMINFSPTYQVELLVMLPGRPPTPVTRTEIIPPLFLSRAMPGQSVTVRVMPDDPTDLYIDWAAA
jgi:hypothetical protein